MGKFITVTVIVALCGIISVANARIIPERDIPAPDTVSPQLKKAIEAGLPEWWKTFPETVEEWKEFQRSRDTVAAKAAEALGKKLNVHWDKGLMAGVPVFIIEPDHIPEQNRQRVLLHAHGGGYVLNAGEAGIREGLPMAGIGKFKVVSVDYRMPPEFPYPAALDDSMRVYRSLLEKYPPGNIGIFGTSTGGGLTLSLVLLAKRERLPLPGAIAAGTPWADLTPAGDSYKTNKMVDNVLVGYNGWLKAAALAYADGHNLKDPLPSPVYGEVSGFPPTILGTGTRDLFLSNTARMHRKLLEANVPAKLMVLEGLSHAQYMMLETDAQETLLYFGQLAKFFDKYLK